MISIAEAISDLLFVRETVVVPGLGAFVKMPVSAKVNTVANYFAAPASQITFDENMREDNDLVIRYLAEKNDIPEDEAQRLLMMFVSDCFNSLKAGKRLVLKDFGTLYYDWAHDLVFEQAQPVNYNSDAFGLCDFSPTPVIRPTTKEEIKSEIEQRHLDKNTPVTVDEIAVHEQDGNHRRRFAWLWVFSAMLLLMGVGYGLQRFRVVDFGQWMPQEKAPTATEPWMVRYPIVVKTWKTEQAVPVPNDSLVSPQVETAVETTLEPPEAQIRIVAGCFSQEENAERLANSLRDNGFRYAFIEKRGSKWFVAYGRYPTDEEANDALREIREKWNDKAWILK